jgi:peptidyl-prolyl cis-trans isomerase B (cyclophilin B)
MAGVDQATAPGSATPDESPESEEVPGEAATPARSAGPAHAELVPYRPRHAKRRRRRWPVLVAAGVALAVLGGVGTVTLIANRDDEPADTAAPTATRPAATNIAPAPAGIPTGSATPSTSVSTDAGPATGTDCRFDRAQDKNPQIVPPTRATRTGQVLVTIGTNRGPVAFELDATNAPCTVESFLTLATGGYFNDTACHRLTTLLIFVLQCGDPTATGSGDPGYSFDDENLPAPGGTAYPRGTLAMANAGPDTNGSQFFIVYKDSPIDPNYPVFGKVTGGLEIVDQVAAGGAPGNDGPPNDELVIQAVQIT